ncbi:MAG: alanine racemase [Bacilli bacterium]|nr:alanine racemase [Bacilli bacterium]
MDKYLSINSENLRYNLDYYKGHTNKKIIAVVKNNAYGHGVKEVSNVIDEKVNMYAVSNLKEARELKEYTSKDILILDRIDDLEDIDKNLIVTIISIKHLKKMIALNKSIRIHLKVNVAMKRKGILLEEVNEAITLIKESKLILEGIYTHYSTYKLKIVKKEFKLFKESLKDIDITDLLIHASSSISSLNLKENFTNCIRVGIGMYGLKKLDKCMNKLKVTTSLYAYSKSIYKIKCFNRFSYHDLYIGRKGYVLMCVLGYGDGLFSKKFIGYCNGKYIKEIGNKNMDNMYFYSRDYVFDNSRIELFGSHVSLDRYCKKNKIAVCKILASLNANITKKIE